MLMQFLLPAVLFYRETTRALLYKYLARATKRDNRDLKMRSCALFLHPILSKMDSKELAYFIDACRRGDEAEVAQLCEMFPELVNGKDVKGFTPLIIAVYNNQPGVVSLLIKNGADVNAQDAAGNTALMGASFKGYRELAQVLIDAGADVNLRNFQGAPALTFAATFGQLAIAEGLLKMGARTDFPDSRGKTSADHAAIQENEEMLALFQRYQSAAL